MKIRSRSPLFWLINPAPLRNLMIAYLILAIFFAWIGQALINQAPPSGPILFWYGGGIYTINPDGSNFQRRTRALLADQRFSDVSAGCHGLVEAPCWVLIGHIVYHVSGRGLPLPLLANQEWVNAPASWSPDGVHLAYSALNQTTGDRDLLIFDVLDEVVWLAAEKIDDSIKPAWSQGCIKPSFQHCFLAYAYKGEIGQTGARIAVQNLKNWQIREQTIRAGLGNRLQWAEDDRLYFGNLNWYDVEAGVPITPNSQTPYALSLSPTADYLVYIGDRSDSIVDCRNCAAYGLWLEQPFAARSQAVYSFPAGLIEPTSPGSVMWQPDGRAFATFQQGNLLYYDLHTGAGSIWSRGNPAKLIDSYAFSPDGEAMALVQTHNPADSEKPLYRFSVVSASGEVVQLRSAKESPIVVLAWLAAEPDPYFFPRSLGEYTYQFQRSTSGVEQRRSHDTQQEERYDGTDEYRRQRLSLYSQRRRV